MLWSVKAHTRGALTQSGWAVDATAMATVMASNTGRYGAARDRVFAIADGDRLAGGPNMVAYGATKAFDMVLAEALWSELHTIRVSTCWV